LLHFLFLVKVRRGERREERGERRGERRGRIVGNPSPTT